MRRRTALSSFVAVVFGARSRRDAAPRPVWAAFWRCGGGGADTATAGGGLHLCLLLLVLLVAIRCLLRMTVSALRRQLSSGRHLFLQLFGRLGRLTFCNLLLRRQGLSRIDHVSQNLAALGWFLFLSGLTCIYLVLSGKLRRAFVEMVGQALTRCRKRCLGVVVERDGRVLESLQPLNCRSYLGRRRHNGLERLHVLVIRPHATLFIQGCRGQGAHVAATFRARG